MLETLWEMFVEEILWLFYEYFINSFKRIWCTTMAYTGKQIAKKLIFNSKPIG